MQVEVTRSLSTLTHQSGAADNHNVLHLIALVLMKCYFTINIIIMVISTSITSTVICYSTKYFGLLLVSDIDNHDCGYLGMAVQLFVQAHLGSYHILTQKDYSPKLLAQLECTPLFTYIIIMHNLNFCRKHNATTCKNSHFVLTD